MAMFTALRARVAAWRDRRDILKEFNEINQEAAPYLLFEAREAIAAVVAAVFRERKDQARTAFNIAYSRFPVATMTSKSLIGALILIGLHDEAERLIQEARAKYPWDPDIGEFWGFAARQRGDAEEAARRFEVVRKQFPDVVKPHVWAASYLRDVGRFDEADAILSPLTQRFPDDQLPASEYALVAVYREDWTEALRRYEMMRTQLPDAVDPWLGAAKCHLKLGAENEAEQILLRAKGLYPHRSEPSVDLALLAQQRGQWDIALSYWKIVRSGWPQVPRTYVAEARILRDLGRADEGEAILALGVERAPSQPDILAEYARFAHGRGDLEEEIERWAMFRELFPKRPEGWDSGANALAAAGRAAEAEEVRSGKS
jgi:tetratricopeptide (TPR) repeat protein